jgi:hypothetical protein
MLASIRGYLEYTMLIMRRYDEQQKNWTVRSMPYPVWPSLQDSNSAWSWLHLETTFLGPPTTFIEELCSFAGQMQPFLFKMKQLHVHFVINEKGKFWNDAYFTILNLMTHLYLYLSGKWSSHILLKESWSSLSTSAQIIPWNYRHITKGNPDCKFEHSLQTTSAWN